MINNRQAEGTTSVTNVNENPLGLSPGDKPVTCTYGSQTSGWSCK